MASLNLQPNPAIIAAQAGFFLASYVVVKKFIVTPYLELREQRESKTLGSKNDASGLVDANQEASERIEQSLSEAGKKARELIAEARHKALTEKDAIIGQAESEATSVLEKMRVSIKETLAEERSKVPNVVSQLTQNFYQSVLH